MKQFSIISAAALALALAACGEVENTATDEAATSGAERPGAAEGQVHSATGEVKEIAGDQITIAHGPVEEIGWPAMTMAFRAESAGFAEGIEVGDPVSFEFREADGDYVLTSISRAQ